MGNKQNKVAKCVGCGCTDLKACKPDGCTWINVDYEHQVGVCSKCVSRENVDKFNAAVSKVENRREFLSREKRKEGRVE